MHSNPPPDLTEVRWRSCPFYDQEVRQGGVVKGASREASNELRSHEAGACISSSALMVSLPERVDLIVIGTGVSEALVACAAAFQGRKVLVLDDQRYYGGVGATLNLTRFWEWYAEHAAKCEQHVADREGLASSTTAIQAADVAERSRFSAQAACAVKRTPSTPPAAAGLRSSVMSNSSVAHTDALNSFLETRACPLSTAKSAEAQLADEGAGQDPCPRASAPKSAHSTGTLPLRRSHLEVLHLQAHVQSSKVLGRDNDYCVDLAHQALECTGPCIEAIRKAGLHLYIDFLPVAGAFVYDTSGQRFVAVPSSTAAVHGTPDLSMEDRRRLWLFMRQVDRAATGVPTALFEGKHFLADLERCGLPKYTQDALLYAVMGRQDAVSKHTELPGQRALAAIGCYVSQAGTYVDEQAPYIEPCYGSSEIAQAAIRACCVHGGIVALDCSLDALLLADNNVVGVRMSNGDIVRCAQVVASQALLTVPKEPDTTSVHSRTTSKGLRGSGPPGGPTSEFDDNRGVLNVDIDTRFSGGTDASVPLTKKHIDCSGPEHVAAADEHQRYKELPWVQGAPQREGLIARGILLLSGALLGDVANARITIPPAAAGNPHTVTVWQCHSSLRVCPEQHSLLYLSCKIDWGTPAADVLKPCVAALLRAAANSSSRGTAAAAEGHELDQELREPRSTSQEEGFMQQKFPLHGSTADQGRASGLVEDQDGVAGPTGVQACVACYYVQQTCTLSTPTLPKGVFATRAPGTEATLDAAAAHAEALFAQLLPGVEFLSKPAQTNMRHEGSQQQWADAGQDESQSGVDDDENALDAALLALGVQ